MWIDVLLPVHNRRHVTARFIDCLTRQTHREFRLILLDDGSSDGTAEMVVGELPSTVVLRGRGDWWWAGALQHGFAWLESHPRPETSAVLIINDDTEFAPEFLEQGLGLLEEFPRSLIVAAAYDRVSTALTDAGVIVDWRRLDFARAELGGPLNCCSTRGLFVPTAALREVGWMYPRLLPHYLSDYEFTIRARRAGWKLVCSPELKLHVDPSTTASRKLPHDSVRAHIRTLFSKRYPGNPQAWTAFVLLTCPWRWKVIHLARIWLTTFRSIARCSLGRRRA